MGTLLWVLLAGQIFMGAFDTLWHHEFTERLAWKPSQRHELKLHGVRNLIYALLFLTLGWTHPSGLLAWIGLGVLIVELLITLKDFVEEDQTRRLPASERITHTLLALNYGAIIMLLVAHLLVWSRGETALTPANNGLWAWFMTAAALGVGIFGIRDLFAARRLGLLQTTPAHDLLAGLSLKGHVLVTGGTGFIGTRLVQALVAQGVQVTILTRSLKSAVHLATPVRLITSLDDIADQERFAAIINLAGEPLAGALWTKRHLDRVTSSRIKATQDIGHLVARLTTKPDCVISGSAIGIYGIACDVPTSEADAICDDGSFGRTLCKAWEAASASISDLGVRTVILRTGLVLDRDGGPLGQMLFPFEFGIGGPFGRGQHWMSWITRDDLVRLIGHCIMDERAVGPINGVGPRPVQNYAFAKALGTALRRPAFIPVPASLLTAGLGGLGREVLLGSQHILPTKALALGFTFRAPDLQLALNEMVRATEAPVTSLRVKSA